MAEERYDPFSNAVVFGPDGQRESLSAVADPATSVAEPAPPVEPQEPDVELEEQPPADAALAPDEAAPEPASEEEQPEDTPDAPQRRRRDPSVRFADLARQRNEAQLAQAQAEGRAAALQAELDFFKQQALQPPRPPEPTPVPQDGLQRTPQGRPMRPQEEAYATTQDYHQALLTYEDALGQWHAQQALAQYEQQRTEREATAKVLERYPDFYQVVQQSRIPVNEHVGAAINASPDKPALLYYLATHPADAQALTPLMGAQAFRAIAALEVRLSAEAPAAPPPTPGPGEPSPQPPPAPPPPIAPTRATGARAPRSYDDVSFMEFYDWRNKEDQARRR